MALLKGQLRATSNYNAYIILTRTMSRNRIIIYRSKIILICIDTTVSFKLQSNDGILLFMYFWYHNDIQTFKRKKEKERRKKREHGITYSKPSLSFRTSHVILLIADNCAF